jgi:hypothetical protein
MADRLAPPTGGQLQPPWEAALNLSAVAEENPPVPEGQAALAVGGGPHRRPQGSSLVLAAGIAPSVRPMSALPSEGPPSLLWCRHFSSPAWPSAVSRPYRMTNPAVASVVPTGDFRDDIAPGELATYCLHALSAASSLPSKAAVRRLVSVALAGLHPKLSARADRTETRRCRRPHGPGRGPQVVPIVARSPNSRSVPPHGWAAGSSGTWPSPAIGTAGGSGACR